MEVTVVEPYGDKNVVHLTDPDQDDDDDVLQAITKGVALVDEGAMAVVTIDPGTIHVFDEASGRALHNRRIENDASAVREEGCVWDN